MSCWWQATRAGSLRGSPPRDYGPPSPPCLPPEPQPCSVIPSAGAHCTSLPLSALCWSWRGWVGACGRCVSRPLCRAGPGPGSGEPPKGLALTLGQPTGASASPWASMPLPFPCPPALEVPGSPMGLGDRRAGQVSHFLRFWAR